MKVIKLEGNSKINLNYLDYCNKTKCVINNALFYKYTICCINKL